METKIDLSILSNTQRTLKGKPDLIYSHACESLHTNSRPKNSFTLKDYFFFTVFVTDYRYLFTKFLLPTITFKFQPTMIMKFQLPKISETKNECRKNSPKLNK